MLEQRVKLYPPTKLRQEDASPFDTVVVVTNFVGIPNSHVERECDRAASALANQVEQAMVVDGRSG